MRECIVRVHGKVLRRCVTCHSEYARRGSGTV